MGVPQNHPFIWFIHYKPCILGYPHLWKPPYVHIQPDGSFTVPWFLKNVVLVLAKRTFWVQKSFLKKVHRKMLSSTLPAFCGQKRAEFGFPFFSSQLCQVEARFGQQVSYLYIYKCIISIYVSICMIAISVYVYIWRCEYSTGKNLYMPLRICSASER